MLDRFNCVRAAGFFEVQPGCPVPARKMAAFGIGVVTRRFSVALGQQQSHQAQVFGQAIQPAGLHRLGETVKKIQRRVEGFVAD